MEQRDKLVYGLVECLCIQRQTLDNMIHIAQGFKAMIISIFETVER